MRQLVVAFVSLVPLFPTAHGLLLDAESDARTIAGTAYYSNGERAANKGVSLLDLSTVAAEPVAARTNTEGHFSFKVDASHRYRVAVYEDEGHEVEVELLAQPKAKRELIGHDGAMEKRLGLRADWAVIAGILLMSLVVPVARSRPRTTARETLRR